MKRHDEIASTERLLELIRREDAAGIESQEPVSSSKVPKGRKPQLFKMWPPRKTITVGVDIGEKDLKLVKATQTSEQRWELLDFTSVPLEAHIPKDSPQFSQLLRAALSDFCGSSDQCKLWTIMSSALVEMRDIRIPSKVPRKQIYNAVYWTLKKEIPFNEKVSIFNFEVIGDIVEQGVNKTAVRVYTAPREEVSQLKNVFANTGYTLAGISIAPFAVQNLLRAQWMEISETTVASLYVGTDRSRIDIFSSGNVVFTRGIKTGMNSIIEGISEGLKNAQEENEFQLTQKDGSPHLTMRDGEAPMTVEHARKVLFGLAPDFPSL
ncbi:MAG: pilus assembly protein PilM, partial [Desulfobacteraceae bacterium]|nr:pilus assembly protein PilM [Desulfobacteraceae bacterium]